jgi:hypothetical protein
LHTNSAAGVIPRLIDLGVSPQILAAALSVSIAQRLVRKVCTKCSEKILANQKEEQIIRDILIEAEKNAKPIGDYGMRSDQEIFITRGRGCAACNQTGYKGRIGIYEAIITDDTIEELLNQKPSEQDVRRVAEKQGLLNMREDGILKVLNGITSFEEIRKVIDLDIKNITQTDSLRHEITHKIEAIDNITPIMAPSNINPSAILNTKSIEISLLVDYLRSLEHQQIINPDDNVGPQIAKIQTTILELLKNSDINALYNPPKETNKTHQKFTRLAEDLSDMHEQQRQNPEIDMSVKLRRVREEIEHH